MQTCAIAGFSPACLEAPCSLCRGLYSEPVPLLTMWCVMSSLHHSSPQLSCAKAGTCKYRPQLQPSLTACRCQRSG